MRLLIQILYVIMGIGSAVLDYFMIDSFKRDEVHKVYRYLGEYTEIAELVIYLMFLYIGIFVKIGGIKSATAKSTWTNVVTIFMILGVLESLLRLVALTILSIHIHPGKTDFMGLFLMLMILYLVMKYGIMLALGTGLNTTISNVKEYKSENDGLKIDKYA